MECVMITDDYMATLMYRDGFKPIYDNGQLWFAGKDAVASAEHWNKLFNAEFEVKLTVRDAFALCKLACDIQAVTDAYDAADSVAKIEGELYKTVANMGD